MKMSAQLSRCGEYRYTLGRRWGEGERMVVWIGLNPSTADAAEDDPTIRRMIGFSKRDGADGMVVVNLFALRSTDPTALGAHVDAVGPENDEVIREACEGASRVVVAWGGHRSARARSGDVLEILRSCELGERVSCLGMTQGGMPRHPLYVAGMTAFQAYDIC